MKLAPKVFNPPDSLNDPRLSSAFSRRAYGNMSLSYGNAEGALDNRKNFLSNLNIDYKDLICAKQAHGNNIRYVNAEDKGRGALAYATAIEDTDGFITDLKGLPLAIFTADCLSIFLYDPQRPAISLIHAGWRSSKENIVSRAIKLMQDKFHTRPEQLFAGFGPAIRGCCYEVSAEFKNYFSSGLVERGSRLYLDLAGVNKQQLLDLGLRGENIFDSGFCTCCANSDFFSFRKEGAMSGRMLSVMMLR
ncbi:MAG: peptidoglycan editing factor PgeF [Candidatus Omnitrophica bacterium]|nr:peptidoglycan editing factor PgeF [Candidatus Omnitrophota bacterium]